MFSSLLAELNNKTHLNVSSLLKVFSLKFHFDLSKQDLIDHNSISTNTQLINNLEISCNIIRNGHFYGLIVIFDPIEFLEDLPKTTVSVSASTTFKSTGNIISRSIRDERLQNFMGWAQWIPIFQYQFMNKVKIEIILSFYGDPKLTKIVLKNKNDFNNLLKNGNVTINLISKNNAFKQLVINNNIFLFFFSLH